MASSKYDLDERDPVSSEFAYDTFSKAGFKPVSSICEIIDNSIEADSDDIILRFEWAKPKQGGYKRTRVYSIHTP